MKEAKATKIGTLSHSGEGASATAAGVQARVSADTSRASDDALFTPSIEDVFRLPAEDDLSRLARLFHLFNDPTRLRILFALFKKERRVGDIANIIGMTQSAVSHQLRLLRQVDLVRTRREKQTVFYALADEHVRSIVKQGLEHVRESTLTGKEA